jgi:hypothetical protein
LDVLFGLGLVGVAEAGAQQAGDMMQASGFKLF